MRAHCTEAARHYLSKRGKVQCIRHKDDIACRCKLVGHWQGIIDQNVMKWHGKALLINTS
jgi:hypothetical protein